MTWDFEVEKTLRHGEARFVLQVHVSSPARRLALHGPSGAGKTQTLKMLAGIVRPERGRIAVAGRTLFDSECRVDLAPQRRRLACVFQDYALFPHLTARQNIAFARRAGWLNPPRDIEDALVQRWIDAFQLGAVAGQYPHQLSGGQRQRTALARALVTEPAALLLDEPFAALDSTLRRRLRAELHELQARLAIPMLLVTHDAEDLDTLADEVVHLDDGRRVQPLPALSTAT